MNARQIVNALAGRWYGRYGLARCPVHDDRSPSLSIADGQKCLLVKCHAGCEPRAILGELERVGLHDREGEREAPPPSNDDGRTRAALRILSETIPAAGTATERYLRGRLGGNSVPTIPPSLRHHADLKHTPSGTSWPSMVAEVVNSDGEPIACHRTYLTWSGDGKAPIDPQKMSLGSLGDGAVQLARAAPIIGLAEGIETALSAMQIFALPVWAVLGGGRFGSIRFPREVRHVVIFADGGIPGLKLAHEGAEKLMRRRYKVTIKSPPGGVGDWNEAIQTGREAA